MSACAVPVSVPEAPSAPSATTTPLPPVPSVSVLLSPRTAGLAAGPVSDSDSVSRPVPESWATTGTAWPWTTEELNVTASMTGAALTSEAISVMLPLTVALPLTTLTWSLPPAPW